MPIRALLVIEVRAWAVSDLMTALPAFPTAAAIALRALSMVPAIEAVILPAALLALRPRMYM